MSLAGDGPDTDSAVDGASAWSDSVDHVGQQREIDQNENSAPPVQDENDFVRSDFDTSEYYPDSEEDYRENRFDGHSSNWRFFTNDERGLAASLDQQQANDLSLHLYNTHALKARACSGEGPDSVPDRPSKKRRTRIDADDSPGWLPDKAWSAWPMKPNLVPRRREQFGLPIPSREEDDATYRRAEAWTPSADLEEEVKALILRKAKAAHQGSLAQDSNSGDFQMMADEEKTNTLLDPTVRHILSDLDRLLEGLHKARKDLAHSTPRSRSRSRQKMKLASEGELHMKRQSTADEILDDPAPTTSDNDQKNGNGRPDTKRRRPINPRDWIEVLNTASFVGWKSSVVDRAAARCTSLFNEEMHLEARFEKPNDDTLAVTRPPNERRSNGAVEKVWHYCPVVDCKRKDEPFDKAWRLREHLKRSHKYDKQDIEDAERRLNTVVR